MGTNKRKSLTHIIRTKSNREKEVKITRGKAIKIHCTECMGYGEVDPKNCTSTLCALYPYRGKTWAAYDKEDNNEER